VEITSQTYRQVVLQQQSQQRPLAQPLPPFLSLSLAPFLWLAELGQPQQPQPLCLCLWLELGRLKQPLQLCLFLWPEPGQPTQPQLRFQHQHRRPAQVSQNFSQRNMGDNLQQPLCLCPWPEPGQPLQEPWHFQHQHQRPDCVS
jgi:hypothetical protein